MVTIELTSKQIAESATGISGSPILASYFSALADLHSATTEFLEATEVAWKSGGLEIEDNTDQDRRVVLKIHESQIELMQERLESEAVPVCSEVTVDPVVGGDFQYLLISRPRNLSTSHVSKEFDEAEPTNTWTINETNLLLSPDIVQKATDIVRHFTEVVKAAREAYLHKQRG